MSIVAAIGKGPERSDGDPELVLALWELVRTEHIVARAFTAVFAKVGVTPAQFGVLASIADEPDITQAQLARNVLVRPQTVTRIVADLVDAGLIERTGSGRGRAAPLRLSAEGADRLNRAWPGVMELNSPTRTGLTDPELRTLAGLLIKLRGNLGASTAASNL